MEERVLPVEGVHGDVLAVHDHHVVPAVGVGMVDGFPLSVQVLGGQSSQFENVLKAEKNRRATPTCPVASIRCHCRENISHWLTRRSREVIINNRSDNNNLSCNFELKNFEK